MGFTTARWMDLILRAQDSVLRALRFFAQDATQPEEGKIHNTNELLWSMHDYFIAPMSTANKIVAAIFIILAITFIVFLMVRTIIFIWRGGEKKRTLL